MAQLDPTRAGVLTMPTLPPGSVRAQGEWRASRGKPRASALQACFQYLPVTQLWQLCYNLQPCPSSTYIQILCFPGLSQVMWLILEVWLRNR